VATVLVQSHGLNTCETALKGQLVEEVNGVSLCLILMAHSPCCQNLHSPAHGLPAQ